MKINIDQFKFSMPINIRWNDMDALGHVNNVYYFEYFQVARGIYMPTVSENWDWTKFMFVIAHIECNYIQELSMLHKKPEIKVRASRLGNKSFDFEYVIISEKDDGEKILHATGKSTQVMINTQLKKSIELPDWLRSDLSNYEIDLK